MHRAPALVAMFAGLGPACGSDAAPEPVRFVAYEPAPGTAARLAYDAGLTRYLGATPAVTVDEGPPGTTTYEFDPADGPACMRGDVYRASTREGDGEDLLIFLQGGGACWSDFCLAVTTAPPGIPRADVLRNIPDNPLAGWDLVYLPYCDGSLFAGDNAIDEDGDGAPDRIHRGLANLSAALTVGYERFPHPRRVVLAGASGGGFGTIMASFVVRYVYPDAPIYVLDDAGVGVARAGDAAFVERLMDEFGARPFLPSDCTDCIGDGHITGLVGYLLAHDPGIRFAAISSWYDLVLSDVFLGVTAESYQAALEEETGALHAAHPDQYRRFMYDGNAHTVLLGDVTGIIGRDLAAVELPDDGLDRLADISIESMYEVSIDGTTVARWIAPMIADDLTGWADLTATPTPPTPPTP